MVTCFIKILDLEYLSFLSLTISQKNMFKRIHSICASPNGPIRVPKNRSLHIEVHYLLTEDENGKAKLAHYLVQFIDSNDLDDQ